MDDRHIRRWTRRLTILGVLLLISLWAGIAVMFMVLSQPHDNVRNYVRENSDRIAKLEQAIAELSSQPAATPVLVPKSEPGVNTTIVQRETRTVIKSVPVKEPKDGKNGKDGRTLELRRDPQTGDIEKRYAGDTLWTVLVKSCELLQQPCEEKQP